MRYKGSNNRFSYFYVFFFAAKITIKTTNDVFLHAPGHFNQMTKHESIKTHFQIFAPEVSADPRASHHLFSLVLLGEISSA